jgi:hypothetical protein
VNTTDPSLPNYCRPEAVQVKPDLDLVADLLAGTRRMWDRALAAKYIRKWTDEDSAVYLIRSQCETVFEGLGRVLSACVGMLFAKQPAIVWNQSETAFEEHWQNLDGQGTAGPVLCKRFSDQSIRDGIGAILVDHPPAPKDVVVTDANASELGLRPTWSLYERSQIISWRYEIVANALTLTQLVLEECSREASGTYGVTDVKRYRVLRLLPTAIGRVATWELFRETKEAGMGGFVSEGKGVYLGMGREGLTRPTLPVAIAHTGRTDAPLCASLPLLGVAWANLAHWRLSTALNFAREVASYAQGVIVGELVPTTNANGAQVPGKVKLGPLALIHLQGENASFDWKAPPVDAFDALEKGIMEKLQQIGQMGMSFMVTDTRAAETARAKELDATAENSTLATSAQAIQDAWNLAMEIHAWYLGIEKEGAPVMTINKDFNATVLDAPTMAVYIQAVSAAGLPVRLLLEAWQKGGRIPEDTDLDELEAEMMANAQAAADQKAAELAAQQNAGGNGGPSADNSEVVISDAQGNVKHTMTRRKKPAAAAA